MIKAENINIKLSGKDIVKNVSIEANDGEVVGLIGPNGSGKSTLLKCIYRVIKPTSGAIYFNGKNVSDISYNEGAQFISVVPQFTNLNFDFTVKEMVLMGRNPYKNMLEQDTKEDFDMVNKAISAVGMEKFANRKFLSLSGGEKQRILLARALAQNTKVMVLDEPTNHLDIKYQIQIMDIICSLGKCVILALHDLNLAMEYCDRIYVLKNGKMEKSGKPQDVITKEFVKKVYDTNNEIIENPVTKKPMIVYLSSRGN